MIGGLRARSVARNPDTELAAVADVDDGRAARAAAGTGARLYADYRPLLEETESDAVIVSSPVPLHEEMILAALNSGKHVLCEKPLAGTPASCRRILEAARSAEKRVAVGFNHRYYPAFKFLKRVVDEGRIGALDHVRVFGGHDGLANLRADWMYEKKLAGGGAMMDVGHHMTDLVRFILGEIREVYGVTGEDIWKVAGSEDRAFAIFKAESGVPVLYEATWDEWKGYQVALEAYGALGMVRAAYAPMFNLLVTQARPGAPRRRRVKRYPEIIVREKLRGWQSTALLSFEEELADFLRMIDGATVPLADGYAGLRAVEIANAVYQSNASGRPMPLSPS